MTGLELIAILVVGLFVGAETYTILDFVLPPAKGPGW